MTITRNEAPRERGLLHYVGIGLSFGLLALVIALAALLIVVPKVGGATPLTVLTQSMEPTLPPGTLVVVGPVEPADVRVGDVVTYQIRSGEPEVITHRVIAVTSASDGSYTFTTKGDNNAVEDPPVVADQLKGRLWYSIPLVGWVNAAVNGDARSWIVPGLAIALFGYAAFMIVSGVIVSMRRRRGSDADSTTDADHEASVSAQEGVPADRTA
ncbi:signal peptidase I [Leifsonia sp. Leaf264]|uniref:signal peptidase I n=1 Tax=Leifsonia sp. Leaf264 TaxID=1736314 RepID=UPI0006FD3943|nr:signal peptidase I [Leifsonia sp. Leaf264]KQO96667.1 S26 family signal peptidase [Leifsonia sp. Leaf264]